MIYFIFSLLSYVMIITFFYSNHPLFMTTMIALQSVLISMTIYLFNSISWFSYLLFMIFLSGMLVVLIYVSSLASNLTMKYFFLDTKSLVIFSILLFLPPFLMYEATFFYNNNMDFSNLSNLIMTASKVYSSQMYLFTVLIICYLLILLILVVKNSLFTKGPLRSSP
uniref:NADH dehydrogenase subunit 6 n=1 Tax=Metacrangonyx spinicaudatus TaxID=1199190 RepID=K7ZWK2_9CRUS|nr:NADH dehydrogenase subunit 6 [Metacrangonyx spinicaudatus]CCI69430.1 NADH dehydrogenase subunit 6 [Metacrangonyx spinicaudatus]